MENALRILKNHPIIFGFLLFSTTLLAGLYLGYTEGIRADELGTSPRMIQKIVTWTLILAGLLGNLAVLVISSRSK